ncbi:MAG: hypothetical protein DWQ34_15775 [Planctomycetota bacterium]|nr:MAG: hypothetical protein DWQ34_15775 [Planctomycetota bacterium]REK20147.1 MAG: hypothetical protein DWQ41_26245 [Planctomycetota bacterium]REK32123.1 MAG: hypothetical protein DWQ45_17775 [Planctomycetota bacterium]
MGFVTVGEIARRAGVPVHRVTYLIESRRIVPLGRAGQARVFSEEVADEIIVQLRQIATSRGEHTETHVR